MQLRPTQVAEQAEAAGLPLLKPQRLKGNTELLSYLQTRGVEALVVASYGKIIPPGILGLTPWPLNVHPSALPLLRGPSPLRTALLEGLQETEVCIMAMTPRIDDGPVLLRAALGIPVEMNHAGLEDAAGTLGGQLIVLALDLAESGGAVLMQQDHAAATYTQVHHREDSWLHWENSAAGLVNFIRAWDPDIGACTSFRAAAGAKRLKIWRSEAVAGSEDHAAPGTVVLSSRHELHVQCGAGVLSILEVQPESRNRMPITSFLAGSQVKAGDVLGLDYLA
jgi:methionyl-tRNA formyltransferase